MNWMARNLSCYVFRHGNIYEKTSEILSFLAGYLADWLEKIPLGSSGKPRFVQESMLDSRVSK